ncbi:hypothetical protein FBU30_001546 [Linnemannia zychae]|nr:hypothetical protein FBU30_001546 [Linnemannia zychae]
MAARVGKVHSAILELTEELKNHRSKDLQDKGKAMEKARICDDEFLALEEMIALLQPLADFTHWAESATKPTLSHVYARVHSILPSFECIKTPQAQELYRSLQKQIMESWPLDKITAPELLAIYLNPVCAGDAFLESVFTNPERTVTLRKRAENLLSTKILQRLE